MKTILFFSEYSDENYSLAKELCSQDPFSAAVFYGAEGNYEDKLNYFDI